MDRLNINLPTELYDRLRSEAKAQERTITVLVCRALEDYLAKQVPSTTTMLTKVRKGTDSMKTTLLLLVVLICSPTPAHSQPVIAPSESLSQRAHKERAQQILKNKMTPHARRRLEVARRREEFIRAMAPPPLPGTLGNPEVGDKVVLDTPDFNHDGALIYISEVAAALLNGPRIVPRGTTGKITQRFASASGVFIYTIILDGDPDAYYIREDHHNIRILPRIATK